MKKFIAIILAVSVLAATSAFAQEGFYIGGSAGSSVVEESSDGLTFDGKDFAWKIFAGYTFNENFAIEGGWADLGNPDDTMLGLPVSVEADGVELFAVGLMPVNDAVDIFGKVGMISWNSTTHADSLSEDDSGSDFALGAGARLSLSEKLHARAEFEWFNISDADKVWMISIGLEARFE